MSEEKIDSEKSEVENKADLKLTDQTNKKGLKTNNKKFYKKPWFWISANCWHWARPMRFCKTQRCKRPIWVALKI